MASDLLNVRFVATDGLVWQGDALSVLARTVEGDIGILAGHEPLMAVLVPHGAEVVTSNGVRHVIAIDSGFLSVFDNHVSVISSFGELASEISVDDAEVGLAALHARVQAAEASERELRQYRRLQSQVKAGQKYGELMKRNH
ncbi:F0F1 ATP synthase subunit epsilon [Brooklawnia sp.]|uniref:F0F1 ATP synthase subunit epsilon n=1 Tax=Brooklawnia sp. TaxID=2699740 RepID=UPI00311FF81A